jgi:PhnB protein
MAEYPTDGQKERTVQLIPYLVFNGQCEAAFKFYAECLGGKIEAMMPHRGTPVEQHVSPDWQDKILHARLNTGDAVLMGSDAPPRRYDEPRGFSVSLQVKDPAEAERIFRALAEKGSVRMPLDKTSGRNASGCWSIASASLGWSTANSSRARGPAPGRPVRSLGADVPGAIAGRDPRRPPRP